MLPLKRQSRGHWDLCMYENSSPVLMSLMSISDPILWKKPGKKGGEKENIPRVKALINSLSPTEKRELGFHLGMFQTVFLFYRGIKTHITNSNLKAFDDEGQIT